MLNCRQVTRLVSRSMDTPLSWHQRLGMRFHLLYCVWCRRYASQLRFLRSAAQKVAEKESDTAATKLPDETKKQMQERIEQALKNTPPPQS